MERDVMQGSQWIAVALLTVIGVLVVSIAATEYYLKHYGDKDNEPRE